MSEANQLSNLIIEKLQANPKVTAKVSPESSIIEDLGLDSLAVMNFVMEIEDELDLSVPLDRLSDVRTIKDLAECLAELKAKA